MRKSFWRLKEEEKGQNFDKKVNSLTGAKLVVLVRVVLFFFDHFCFFWQQNSELRSGLRALFRLKNRVNALSFCSMSKHKR
jgi:G:T-mismatch repair DNA endonuclease (very short patch repair protein)